MKFEIEYGQTASERYDTNMNSRVRELIEAHDIEIIEEFGGTYMSSGTMFSALQAHAGFVFDTDKETMYRLQPMIEDIVTRSISVRTPDWSCGGDCADSRCPACPAPV